MTNFKICGLTQPDDAAQALELGAWALGMVFWPGSKRRCSLDQAAEISSVCARRAELVGVFVDATLEDVAATADAVDLSVIQLHGSEGPRYCDEVARKTGCKVIKAMRIQGLESVQELRQFRGVEFHMVDAFRPGVPGGTGESFDWKLVKGRAGKIPLILSGGLSPDNVGESIEEVEPYAVDVASGIESKPGIKDEAKMIAFVRAIEQADRQLA